MTTARTLGRVAPTSASLPRVSLWRTPRTRSLLVIGTLAAVGGLATLAAHVYTDFLWYREVGHEEVFWTTLQWKVAMRIFLGCGTATILLLNFLVVDRSVAAMARQGQALNPSRVWAHRSLLFALAALAGGLASNQWAADGAWQSMLLWLHRGDFGVADPLFHRDVGFFVFSLPLYRQLADWLYLTFVATGAATIAAYVAAGAIRIKWPPVIASAVRTHLLNLGALLLVLMAWRYRLDQFALALPHKGAVVSGATYTDVHVQLPMLRVLVWLSLAGAVLCLYAAWRRPRLPVVVAAGVLVLLLGVTAAGRGAVPALVQHLAVEPQELSRERPYVSDSIDATRRAFELDRVAMRSLPSDARLSAEEIAENPTTLDNVPLWDSSVLQPAMDELQSIAPYYNFPSTTVDRYTLQGKKRLVTVAARQVDVEGVKPGARSWANERFAYTHGYGLVATTAQQADEEQQPGFAQRGSDVHDNPLRLREPRIYFGERPDYDPPYAIVGSNRGEVEEPTDRGSDADYHYDGAGGIELSNPLRRIAFAARFGDPKLLLTQTVTPRSRIVLHRDARERVTALAPFLAWDSRPQTAVIDGKIKFLFHGYTTTSHYPYSASVMVGGKRFNYMRAATLAEVDAFDGHVTIYMTDRGDPILRAWRAVYPSLFVPASRMPGELRAHLRYPERLFTAQVQAFGTYHVADAGRFWTAEDAWQRSLQVAGPVELAGEIHFPDPAARVDPDERAQGMPDRWQLRSGYVLARLPGDARERFMLVTQFTRRDRQNLAGYLAGSINGRGRPRLDLLSLPSDRLTVGPTQATRRILANSGVNRRLDLLNRESRDLGKNAVSRTVLGAPRLVPVGDVLLHVQPFYLLAGDNGVPRLQLVTVYVNGRVGYGLSLRAALRRAVVPGLQRGDRNGRSDKRAAAGRALEPELAP